MFGREPPDELVDAKFLEAAGGVQQNITVGGQAIEQIHLLEQRGVLNDQCIRLNNWFTQTNRLLIDSAERHDRRTGALGAEAGKCLRKLSFEEGRHRKQLRRSHHALASAAVNSNLEHYGAPRWLAAERPSPEGRLSATSTAHRSQVMRRIAHLLSVFPQYGL